MKMKKYYPALVERLSSWLAIGGHVHAWEEYVQAIALDSRVSNRQVHLAWDASRLVTTAVERSEWIHDCGANDACFTTLAIAACKAAKML